MHSQPTLLCTVRNCGLALQARGRSFVCERGHSFDVARSDYINLLQPQDRRSREPGDTPQAVAARRRLHVSGLTFPLAQQIAAFLDESPPGPIIDAGCGDGFYLSALSRHFGVLGCGVDISVPAIELASRRHTGNDWVVANADRVIPYASESFGLALSITGRLNAAELQRVLNSEGRLLVALAAPDDLVELRGDGRDRVPQALVTFGLEFDLLRQQRVSVAADLNADQVSDVRLLIYRPSDSKPMQPMRLTFSFDLLLFRRKSQ